MAFCTNCGQRFPEGQRFCAECGTNVSGQTTAESRVGPADQRELGRAQASATPGLEGREAEAFVPSHRIGYENLPREILAGLTQTQRDGLAFGVRIYKVVTARIQSFQTGANSRGHVAFGGLSHALGAHWGAFGGVGAINSSSVNFFRTDLQFKLRDAHSNEGAFIARSLPFAMTLSVDPEDTLEIYFAVGGLPKFYCSGDFALNSWMPFAAKSLNTGQVVPFAPLPSLGGPRYEGYLAFLLILALFGFLLAVGMFSSDSPAGGVFGLMLIAGGGIPNIIHGFRGSNYTDSLRTAMQFKDAVSKRAPALLDRNSDESK